MPNKKSPASQSKSRSIPIRTGRGRAKLSRAQVALLEAVERAGVKSKQPRLDPKSNSDETFNSVLRWIKDAMLDLPPYARNSRKRDAILQIVWQREPLLAGVLNSVVQIDKNRGWSLVGGRNQVNRYTDVLHNFIVAPDQAGWRAGFGVESLAYHTTDLGSITELGRQGKGGPLRGMFHTDPARCELTGSFATPLRYSPNRGKSQLWKMEDYFRITSMQSTSEAFNGLGFCTVSRAFELAKTLIAVYMHDQEMLGAHSPRGLLILNNIPQARWDAAMADREARLSEKEQKYYGAVAVLAGAGELEASAQLLALSQLPANFDKKIFTDLYMYALALIVGYDPREFWPVSSGALGTATESEVQHRKATGKGGVDFALAFQENLQAELPETLQFEFDQRDSEGELLDAQLKLAKLSVITAAYNAGLVQGAPLISKDEGRTLMAQEGIVPEEWTLTEEDVTGTDTDKPGTDAPATDVPGTATPRARLNRDRLLSNERILRSTLQYPDEPIIRYRWPLNKTTVLWQSGRQAQRRLWQVGQTLAEMRAKELGQWNSTAITDEDVKSAIKTFSQRVQPKAARLIGRLAGDNGPGLAAIQTPTDELGNLPVM